MPAAAVLVAVGLPPRAHADDGWQLVTTQSDDGWRAVTPAPSTTPAASPAPVPAQPLPTTTPAPAVKPAPRRARGLPPPPPPLPKTTPARSAVRRELTPTAVAPPSLQPHGRLGTVAITAALCLSLLLFAAGALPARAVASPRFARTIAERRVVLTAAGAALFLCAALAAVLSGRL